MNSRPKISIPLSKTDLLLEIVGWAALIGSWFLVFLSYPSLPEAIPVHFDTTGTADKFGSKSHIFVLPALASVLFVGLTYLNRFPHAFNYPTAVTNQNAFKQYSRATRLVRGLKTAVVLIFGLIIYHSIQSATGEDSGLGDWLLILIILAVNIPVLIYLFQKK